MSPVEETPTPPVAETEEPEPTEAEVEEPKKGWGKGRMKELISEYGSVALVVYLSIAAVVGVAAFIAIVKGLEVEGAGEGAGTLFAVWVVLKITQPFRIGATVALTPIVVNSRLNPFRKVPEEKDEDSSVADDAENPLETPTEQPAES